jgi:DNA primase
MDEFLAGFLSELIKAAAGDPDEVLVEGEHAKLTKSQIQDYYLHPKTRKRLLPQLSGRPVMLVQQHAEPVVRRKTPEGKEIVIEEGAKGPGDPSDYMNWVSQHTVEFHPVHGENVDHLYVDVDPKGNVPWDKTKEITKLVAHRLRQEPDVKGVRTIYSGGRGFYVKAQLEEEMGTNKARERLKRVLGEITKEIPMTTLGVPGPSQVRLDVSTLHDKGSLRAEYSINRRTGLVSIPVKSLDVFQKTDATIKKVLGD